MPETNTTDSATRPRPPHRLLSLAEGRAVFELGAFYAAQGLLTQLPKGDGHTVVALPGFLASNGSTAPLRGLLRDLGYDAHGWDSGRNLRVSGSLIAKLEKQLLGLADASGRAVSLVGWSLGGTIARELAKLQPEAVRFVVTLGSPIAQDRSHARSRKLFELFNSDDALPTGRGVFETLDEAPPVPTTSIFSKTDGVVHWRGSVQAADKVPAGSPAENIIVHASHCGLGVNPSVMVAIADRLAQPEGQWQPFQPKWHQKLWFRTAS